MKPTVHRNLLAEIPETSYPSFGRLRLELVLS